MISKNYIVGLTDGEGSFTAYIRPPSKKHGAKNYRVECHYYVKLREDDLPLLKKVKQFFGVGRISFQKDRRPNHHNCYRYETTQLQEIREIIIPFFDANPLEGNKIHDFRLFKKIVDAVIKKRHQTKNGLEQIKQWKKEMHIFWTR
ncbi:MAG: LAGLIDADG family homing endonuclease [Candidatus Nealsonbacteria bacterium]|nr:LAGLIDADG family homing endonuclease [Candidatus Nealsonbacteria bacterium]